MGRQPMVRQTTRRTTHQPRPSRGLVQGQANLPDQPYYPFRSLRALELRLELRRLMKQSVKWVIDSAPWVVQHHSLAIWLSSLSVLAGIAVASVGALLNPNNSVILPVIPPSSSADPVAPPSPPPVIELPPPEPAPSQPTAAPPPSATSAITAIAFSCAAGCFFLSQSVKPRPAPTHRILAASPATRSSSASSSAPLGANFTSQPEELSSELSSIHSVEAVVTEVPESTEVIETTETVKTATEAAAETTFVLTKANL